MSSNVSSPKASERYNAPAREKHWQQVWEERGTFLTKEGGKQPKCYVLEMFPYPSGRIHVGHSRNYTMGDVLARYKRAKGFNVLHPMGWDAFGMPAENAAMERKIHPAKWTYENIDTMRGQLQSMGLSIDWSREIATCHPDYYRHQQKLFLDFLKKDLVYRKSSKVNWDPVDHTVLANEQVIDGRGWRSGAPVEQRELTQWFFKITKFADDLLEALGSARQVAGEGAPDAGQLDRPLGGPDGALGAGARDGAQGPQGAGGLHHAARHAVRRLVHGASRPTIRWPWPRPRRTPSSPSSAPSAGAWAPPSRPWRRRRRRASTPASRWSHPFDPEWQLPVYVANFILMDYGTGAIFGCPSGDQRDLEFARKYGLPVVPVVLPKGADAATFAIKDTAYTDDGVMINSRFLDGLDTGAAFEEVAKRLESEKLARKPVAKRKVNYRLRDWGISRQRYWGCPIPVIHCEDVRRRAGAGRPAARQAARRRHLRRARQPARPAPDLEARQVSVLRQACPARDGHHGHVRRQLLVLRALHGAPRRHAGRPEGGRLLAAGRPVHRRHRARHPAPALLALLHARDGRHRPPQEGHEGAVRRPLHAGHGGARDLPDAQRRPVAAALRGAHRGRRRRAQGVPRRPPARRSRSAPSRRCRSRRRTPSTSTTSSPSSAPIPRAGSCSPTARPSATSSIPTSASRAPAASCSASGGWWTTAPTVGQGGAKKPERFGPEAEALRRAAHKTLNGVSQNIEGLRFNVAVAQIYEFANKLQTAAGASGEGLAKDLAWALREAAEFLVQMIGPMHAALGRGLLGAAWIQHPAGRSALAGGRSGLAR